MGILGLSRLIADIAPEAIREVEMKSLFGRRVAIDASMSIYQFLIAIRNRDQLMTNELGETTSHLIGLFYRTIKLLELGIKPIYVFDGKAPQLKCEELSKRADRRKEAENKLAEAVEEQDMENISKFNKRVVRVTRQHNNDCKKLLQLLGLPVVESPSEAEAQCAQLCKEGLVYATATEDMDALTFGSPRLVRNMTTSGNNEKVKEYHLDKVLAGLTLSHNQFIDLGILMGCDYCDSIKGIGGKKGLDLIKKYGSIEEILEKKFGINKFFNVEVDYGDRKELIDSEVADKLNASVNEELVALNGEEVKPNEEEMEIKDKPLKPEEEEELKDKELELKDKELELKDKELELKDKELDSKDEELEPKDEELEPKDEELEPKDEELEPKDEELEPKDEELEQKDEEIDETNEESDDEFIDDSQDITESQTNGKKNKKKSGKKDKKGTVVPDNWLFIGARKLFVEPNVLKGSLTEADLKQKDIDEEAVVQFLCVENGFSEDRVRNGIKRVKESKGKSNQTRIDSFFKTMPNINSNSKIDNKNSNDKKKNNNNNNKRNTSQSKGSSKRGRR